MVYFGEHPIVVLRIRHSFPNDFCFALHVSSISISECGLKTIFRTLTNSAERKITSLTAASFCRDRIAQSCSLSLQAMPL